jgi:hypothetical protein
MSDASPYDTQSNTSSSNELGILLDKKTKLEDRIKELKLEITQLEKDQEQNANKEDEVDLGSYCF